MPVKSHPPFQLKTLDACYFQLLSYIFLETPSLSLCLNVLQITSLMPGFSCHKTYLIPKSQNMIAIFWECMFLQCLLGTVVWVWSKALCFLGNCVFFFFIDFCKCCAPPCLGYLLTWCVRSFCFVPESERLRAKLLFVLQTDRAQALEAWLQ